MARFGITFSEVSTNNVANTFRTIAGIIAGANKRGSLRMIDIGVAGQAADDRQLELRVTTSNQSTAGTPASSPTPVNCDPGNPRVSDMTAGVDYTAGEPTVVTVAAPLKWQMGFNSRGGLFKTWDEGKGPKWGASQTLVIQAAPGEAVALKLSGTIEWDE